MTIRTLRRHNRLLFDRDFQRLATLSAVGLTGFGFLLLAIVAFAGWSSNESATDRERVLLQNALNRGIARALSEQKSVAWWDDSVTKITDEAIDLEFVDANFGVFLTETYGHDEVYVLNAKDAPLYAFAEGQRGEPQLFEKRRVALHELILEARGAPYTILNKRPDTFGTDQNDYKTLAGAVATSRWSGHILSIEGRLAIAAAISIVPNVNLELLKGTPNLLISLIYIDEDYVTAMGRSLLLSDLVITSERLEKDGIVSEPFESDDRSISGYLSWTTQRPGHVLLTIILPLLAIGVLSVALLTNRVLVRLRNITADLASSEQEAQHAARHDRLSGLPNRMHFAEKLSDTLKRLQPDRGRRKVVVSYLDIDRFKDVNDTLGHFVGDSLIRKVAERLDAYLPAGHLLARYGGDEFAIMCVTEDANPAAETTQLFKRAFSEPFDVEGHALRVTASAGIAITPEHGEDADELIRNSDIALYEAKSRGRDCCVTFTKDMALKVQERRSIEVDLKNAIDADTLRLAYQPIISCRTGKITGVEALLRWRHAERGELSPAAFIPIAEQTGLMPALGDWVLNRAMKEARHWPHLQVSINLSPVQFRQVGLEDKLRQTLEATQEKASRFVLEITEGVLMESCERSAKSLEAIHELGFKTALDDFGTGYSSLAYLCNFRFDKIKIDRAFVSGMSKSESYRKIVRSVIALGKGLGMEIVAEGVETEGDASAMTTFGCSELQGYYFSRPLDVEPLLKFLESYQPRPTGPLPRLIAIETDELARVG
jgi:diguanylate cyclase (GGDEF)-like protein